MLSVDCHRQSMERWFNRIIANDVNTAAHLPMIRAIVLASDAKYIWELGTNVGNTLLALALGAIDTGGEVFTVDTGSPTVPWINDAPDGLITRVKGDSLKMQMLGAPIDVLLLDTCHDYRHVYCELERWGAAVRPGGTILVHDTVKRPDGAGRAAVEWSDRHGHAFFNDSRQWGMGVIRKS